MKLFDREGVIEGIKKKESFEGVNLKGLDLRNLDLSGINFKGANFRYADLTNTNLSKANLSDSSLRHAVLVNTNLSSANLTNADLTHADIRGTVMVGASLKGTLIQGAKGVSQKVFFTQGMLDDLNASGKLILDDDTITILTKTQPKFQLQQAVRFIKIDEGVDTNKLVGKVKSLDDLKEFKADIFPDSAVVNDSVYRIESGFIGLPIKEKEGERAREVKAKKDEELLSEFFLKNVK